MNDQASKQLVSSARLISLRDTDYQELLLDGSLSSTERIAEVFGYRAANVMKACGIVRGAQLLSYGRRALARERGVGPATLARVDGWLHDFASETHAKWMAS